MLDEDRVLLAVRRALALGHHAAEPVSIELAGRVHTITYQPAESQTGSFGGNSNWRGPVWFPLNYLLSKRCRRFHHYLGDDLHVELPTGSDAPGHLGDVAADVSRRLISLFLPGATAGVRPGARSPSTPTSTSTSTATHGAGLGASHQTGWTALVAKLIRQTELNPP